MNRTGRGANQKPLTPAEALTVLQAAVSYCQLAGLNVLAANSNGALLLTVPGAHYLTDGDRAQFRIGAPDLTEGGAQNKPTA